MQAGPGFAPLQPLQPHSLPFPFPERFYRTWWWVCRCPRFHCIEISLNVQSAVAHGAAGVFSTKDGENDARRCTCNHTFIFGPDSKKKKQALGQAGIDQRVLYSFVPVWAYAGSPHEMQRTPQSELLFVRNMSQMPCLRVLVSNFADEATFPVSRVLMEGWRENRAWQAQVSLARHRMTIGARSDGLVREDQKISTVLMSPLLDRRGSDGQDAEVDASAFWEDSSLWFLHPPPPPPSAAQSDSLRSQMFASEEFSDSVLDAVEARESD